MPDLETAETKPGQIRITRIEIYESQAVDAFIGSLLRSGFVEQAPAGIAHSDTRMSMIVSSFAETAGSAAKRRGQANQGGGNAYANRMHVFMRKFRKIALNQQIRTKS